MTDTYLELSSCEGVISISLSLTLSSSCYLNRGLVEALKYFELFSIWWVWRLSDETSAPISL